MNTRRYALSGPGQEHDAVHHIVCVAQSVEGAQTTGPDVVSIGAPAAWTGAHESDPEAKRASDNGLNSMRSLISIPPSEQL